MRAPCAHTLRMPHTRGHKDSYSAIINGGGGQRQRKRHAVKGVSLRLPPRPRRPVNPSAHHVHPSFSDMCRKKIIMCRLAKKRIIQE